MSKLLKSLLSVFLAVFMVASLAIIPSSAAAPKLNKTSVTVTKGYQTTLSVSNASGTVKWSTGDKSIATVSSKGKVVGKGPGTTYVYAKTGSTTLKCKVKVVASKITSNKSAVAFDKVGDTASVTFTVKGSHSGITVGSTDKSVATAAFSPARWDGDKVTVKITAKGEGTARIKVYNKNYQSTCYKYVDVTVKDTTASNIIMPYTKDVKVNAGESYDLQVYAQNQTNLLYSVLDSKIATVTAGTTSGNYRTFAIKGVAAGTTTVRFYDRYNSKSYVDVKVTVTAADVEYYKFYTTSPATKLLSTDKILTIKPTGSAVTYYMLVPANYDPAYVDTLTAQQFNVYEYYKIYTSIPSRKAATDTYQQFYHTNSAYPYGYRYILLPANYDEVQYNTAVAKYNNKYEYYTIYSEYPAKQNSWDWVENWQVNDPVTGRTITRYMLVPYNYDQTKVDEIKNKDQAANSTSKYYTAYSTYPTINKNTDYVILYYKGSTPVYMVVPKNSTQADIVKANDAILKDTGVYEYNVMYSSLPTTYDSNTEDYVQWQVGSQSVYILYLKTDANGYPVTAQTAITNATNNRADGIK